MKTINRFHINSQYAKKALGLLVAVMAIMALGACSKTTSPSLNSRFGYRTPYNPNNFNGGNYMNQSSGLGCISAPSGQSLYNILAQEFMPGQNSLGNVNDSCGIWLAGSIASSSASGEIEMVVQDQECVSSGENSCYVLPFNVVQSGTVENQSVTTQIGNPQQQGSGANVVVQDGDGVVYFQGTYQYGQLNNGQQAPFWEGQVYFQNNQSVGGAAGNLGTFQIPIEYILH